MSDHLETFGSANFFLFKDEFFLWIMKREWK